MPLFQRAKNNAAPRRPKSPPAPRTVRPRRVWQCPLGGNTPVRLADTHQLYIAANKRRCWRPVGSSPHAAGFLCGTSLLQIANVKANVQVVHLLTLSSRRV